MDDDSSMERLMLVLESFLHRRTLAEILSRWMVNDVRLDDVRQLKMIVNFNLYIARIWVDVVARRLLYEMHGVPPRRIVAKTKGAFKDFAVENLTYTNQRIEEMCARYRRFPEDFYKDTPIDGAYYVVDCGALPTLVGCTRIKRFRRIADKGSRRIVDVMFSRIRENADILAEERAKLLGIPKSRLISRPEEMVNEFEHAERRVIKSIKRGTIQSELPSLSLPDVVGLKLIIEDADYARLLEKIGSISAFRITEEEKHAGNYKAVNLRVECTLPREMLRAVPPSGEYLDLLSFRGFDPARVADDYRLFLDTAEPTVIFEIIVSSFEEYLESEIGRSMHEERVLSQRAHPEYNGHLATNVRYLMQYILGLCRGAGRPVVTDVPIKLWARYMPETIELIIRRLYLPDELFFGTGPEPEWVSEEGSPGVFDGFGVL